MDLDSKTLKDRPVAVLSLGNFGAVVASIIARKRPVLLYSRSQKKVDEINKTRVAYEVVLQENIELTCDLADVLQRCDVIFLIVPAIAFRPLMKEMAPFLQPYHVIIHGTKGLDVDCENMNSLIDVPNLRRDQVSTMSELIMKETVVTQIGCISGPNLSKEIAKGLPTATVIASHFDHVIRTGKELLNCHQLRVFYSHDLIGIELCGVIKNIIALSAGTVHGLKLGHNALGVLIARGLVEMIALGKELGGEVSSFIGLAGIGDLVTTSMSSSSRNFQFGYKFATANLSTEKLLATFNQPVEGINSVLVMKKLANYYNMSAPILESIYQALFEGVSPQLAVSNLMKIPQYKDINIED